tara:strand:+ start:169 stop:333 length:165 start_codon:yes stop_codon:yes gene_type:complete
MTKITLGTKIEKELRAWQRDAMKDIQRADVTSTLLPTVAGWSKAGEMIKEINKK